MTDHLEPSDRSKNMAAIRSKNTQPELAVRRITHSLGYRYRLHVRELPGTPDLVFPRHRKVIFVHGCFWHRHSSCKYASTPKTRVEFWDKKFRANLERDRFVKSALRKLGWKVLIVWQCELKQTETLVKRLSRFLNS